MVLGEEHPNMFFFFNDDDDDDEDDDDDDDDDYDRKVFGDFVVFFVYCLFCENCSGKTAYLYIEYNITYLTSSWKSGSKKTCSGG